MLSLMLMTLLSPDAIAGRTLEDRGTHCYLLGAIEDDGTPYLREARRREQRVCERACEDGSGRACTGVGGILRLQGLEQEALAVYRQACDSLEWSSCRELGDLEGMLAGLDHECASGEADMCERAAKEREKVATAAARQARLDALTCDSYGAHRLGGDAVSSTQMVCLNEAGGLPDWPEVGEWRDTLPLQSCGVEGVVPVRLSDGGAVEVFSDDEAVVACVTAAYAGPWPFANSVRCTFALTEGKSMRPIDPDLPEGEPPWPTHCPDTD